MKKLNNFIKKASLYLLAHVIIFLVPCSCFDENNSPEEEIQNKPAIEEHYCRQCREPLICPNCQDEYINDMSECEDCIFECGDY